MKKTLLVLAAVGALALSACSSDDTDATPGGNGDNANPQATDQPGDDGFNPNASNICELFASAESFGDEMDAASDAVEEALDANPEDMNAPEVMAAVHAQGQAYIAYSDDMAAFFNQAANLADDAEVSQAFAAMADYFEIYMNAMGQAAINANTYMDSFMNIANYIDVDDMMALEEDFSDSSTIMWDYLMTTCADVDFDL
jgi:lipopolysaccharide biosynthesis regulator YciM